MSRNIRTAALTTMFALSGCMADGVSKVEEMPPPTTNPPVTNPPVTNPPPTDGVFRSTNARVKFKGGERYAAALSAGLKLDRSQVCLELGLYDCVDAVHNIALGGVEPYRTGIIEALETTTLTTPIAADRVGLAACTRRAELDFADLAAAEIFGGLEVGDGALVDVDATSVEETVQKLYRRLLARDATTEEVDALRELYREMAAVGDPSLAASWAALSCFAVATTMEALFY